MTRYIFITGGVVSSLGKGLASASLGALLQARGYKVRLRKLDPYLNVDPGTMNPYQHGEVFVTDDGAETDLDLGHYERFTNVAAAKSDNVTTGQIYQTILNKERRGDYKGGTVQTIPHVTDEIKAFITAGTEDCDFVLCEIGGTVGDIEGLPFFEAIRQLRNEMPRRRCLFVHLTLVPWLETAGELKTKPTQHSVKELRAIGIQPDILICRTERELGAEERRKMALFCSLQERAVIESLDMDTIYAAPLAYHAAGLDREVLAACGIAKPPPPDLAAWQDVVRAIREPEDEVAIALVGKYVRLPDAYKSLVEALGHGGIAKRVRVQIVWVDAEEMEDSAQAARELTAAHGVLVASGFGVRGARGKMLAAQLARENKIPFLGICFGMQMAVLEVARHLAGLPDADSSEFGPTPRPLVGLLTEWEKNGRREARSANAVRGGTMRLGAYDARLAADSHVAQIYAGRDISERHRHRYEVNMAYREPLQKAGLHFSGLSPDGQLPEIVEYRPHPWYVGVQFHPELKSRPLAPHPLFVSFIGAALKQSRLV